MKCLCSGEQMRVEEVVLSSESLATKDYSASVYSSLTGDCDPRPDTGNIEEAESSLREGVCLNYEEARALLGRLEYQRGNIEAALHVFDGIDICAIIPKIKLSISKRRDHGKRRSRTDTTPPMSMHAVNLLFEAIFLKAKSLQDLGRYADAAQTCKIILDTVESAFPDGFHGNFEPDCKLQEILCKAVELLPELWKLSGNFDEAILSYRRALLRYWNLDAETTGKMQKEFGIFLLYSGSDANPPNLRSQMEGSFVPKNNIEEAILLFMILLKKFSLKKILWDSSIMDHLTFALTVSGEMKALAFQVEELLPGIVSRTERYYTLALCYFAEDEDLVSLNLLRKLLNEFQDPKFIPGLLLAAKICSESCSLSHLGQEGSSFSHRALDCLHGGCSHRICVANCLLGISLSSQAKSAISHSERIVKQFDALEALERSERISTYDDPKVLFNLSLENAEQRKLDVALDYAKRLLKVEAGTNVRGWILLSQILSAQKQFPDAEIVINIALDQTGKWDQGELLQTKAKIQIAQGKLKHAVQTYTYLLAVLQVQNKSFGSKQRLLKKKDTCRNLEIKTWLDLAHLYTSMSQWNDTEICLSKSKAIDPHNASWWHATGSLCEARGLYQEAMRAFANALELDPCHVLSLVSMAVVLRKLGVRSLSTLKCFLTDALRLDRTNHCAWFNLGLIYKAEGASFEASECFEAAAFLEETTPVESFR